MPYEKLRMIWSGKTSLFDCAHPISISNGLRKPQIQRCICYDPVQNEWGGSRLGNALRHSEMWHGLIIHFFSIIAKNSLVFFVAVNFNRCENMVCLR